MNILSRIIPLMSGEQLRSAAALLLRGKYALLRQQLLALDHPEDATREGLPNEGPCFIENIHWGDFVSRPLLRPVAIVVPFYNCRHLLECLLATLLANTDARHRIVLVDDASTDPELSPLLESFLRQRPETLLLRNEVNRGFVATANLGIQATNSDVVIVNSDVEVPPYWIERLMAPMLADGRIASTTPFTNAGTICSFPRICEDNPLPEQWHCEDIDAQFGRLRCESVPIPTGVGFCMAMSRKAIDRIGAFDEATFGRGYGEENDWCLRASAAGFAHVAVPNLFVYHKHGGTFASEEKQALVAANLRKLHKRYPDYLGQVGAFIRRDPLREARDMALFLAMCHLAPERPLLVVDHGLGGGANAYRMRLLDRERSVRPVIILVDDYHRRQTIVAASFKDWHVEFHAGSVAAAASVLERLPIGEIFYNDGVSFRDPIGLPGLLLSIKQRTGASLTVVIHDFFPICPSFTLLNADGRYCGLPDPAVCDACLPRNPTDFLVQPLPKIGQWRAAWGAVLDAAQRVLCFSENSAKIVVRAYPGIAGRIEVVPHSVPTIAAAGQFVPDFSRGVHIGVVGGINIQKGSQIVVDLARILVATRPEIRLSVIGEFSCPGRRMPANLRVTGRYRPEDLPARLSALGVNVVFFPSIWPETFSYVTSEIIQLGLPLCCFDLGAPAERVRDYRWGRVVKAIDAGEALGAILAVVDEYRRNMAAERCVQAG
jgi:GT2 family glycosyltransferase/glycosyltransferase involved in cell wall biosynthesis